MRMLKPGGTYIGVTPASNFCGHGFYQFSPELYYRVFNSSNGFEVGTMLAWEEIEGSRFYRIPDPEQLRRRVCFVTSRPAYLFVVARRIATQMPLASPPQQSDYARQWKTTGQAAAVGPPLSWRARAGQIASKVPGLYGALVWLGLANGGRLRQFTPVPELRVRT